MNNKYHEFANWMGATTFTQPPSPYQAESFDLVICLETLEHLLDDTISAIISEIYGLLKPGGAALFTTPNNEELSRNFVYCPFCQTEFHQVQHVRSFSEGSL